MKRVTLFLALVLASLAGCAHHNVAMSPPAEPSSGNFPILNGIINRSVEPGSPNL